MSEYESLFADEADDAAEAAGPYVEYRWLNGGLWGLLLGIGVATYALIFRVIELQLSTFLLIVLGGVVLGLAWSRFGPVKG